MAKKKVSKEENLVIESKEVEQVVEEVLNDLESVPVDVEVIESKEVEQAVEEVLSDLKSVPVDVEVIEKESNDEVVAETDTEIKVVEKVDIAVENIEVESKQVEQMEEVVHKKSKRQNGMGSIYPIYKVDKDGKEFIYRYGLCVQLGKEPNTGFKLRYLTTAKTYEEIEEKMKETIENKDKLRQEMLVKRGYVEE